MRCVECHNGRRNGTRVEQYAAKYLQNVSIVKPTRRTNFKLILFWNYTLHVSEGISVHHQESKTVHTTSDICHTGSVAAF
jgi:hypothetical protein